jgi:O-antigen ligase
MTCMPIKRTFQRIPALAILFLFLLWVLIGIGISPLETGPFLTQWTLMLDFAAVAVLAINVLTTRQHLLRLIDAILVPAAFVALYGIYGYFTRQNGVGDPTTSLFRIFSIMDAAPTLALFLSIIIPPAIYRASTLHGWKRLGVSALVFIFLAALALTFTRGAFLCAALSIVLAIIFLPSRKVKIALFIGGVALVLFVLSSNIPFLDRFFNQDVGNLNGRTYLWQALFDNFDPTRVLGNGLGSANAFLIRLQVGVTYRGVIATSPSNLFVGTLYDHGIIGVVLISLMFIVLGIGLLNGMRKTTGDQRLLFIMALIVFVNMILQSLDTNDFWAQSVGIYFWIVMALPFATCWSTQKQSVEQGKEATDESTEPRLPVVRPEKLEGVAYLS